MPLGAWALTYLRIPEGARLVAEAVGSRTVGNRDAALHRAEPVRTEMVVFAWRAGSDHPRFRDLPNLVK